MSRREDACLLDRDTKAGHNAKSGDALSAAIEQAMNAGDAQGWRLINVTQHAATVRLYWDTRPQ